MAIACAGANPQSIPALIAAFVLFAGSFGPTLALAALPANLTQTFASASRLFGLMDEVPAVTENGTVVPQVLPLACQMVWWFQLFMELIR